MAQCIFNPVTLENRHATPKELAALYASAPDASSPPKGSALSAFGHAPPSENDEGGTSDVPPLGDEPSPAIADGPPAIADGSAAKAAARTSSGGPQLEGLEESEVLIDWETHLYDFDTRQVVPIYVPLSQRLEEFKQHLLGEVATLRARIDTLESRVAMLEAAHLYSGGADQTQSSA